MGNILGIETSCDETAAAVVAPGGRVLSNLIASQVDLHARYGGVVPEEAARVHIQACLPLVEEALAAAGCTWRQIESVAVTYGPGLVGCLLVGVETAKALAYAHDKNLIAVNHLEGHLHAIFLSLPQDEHTVYLNGEARGCNGRATNQVELSVPSFPYVGLIVSGGHTSLVLVKGPDQTQTIAQTLDDAAGECYDKVARVAGLGYPGGPLIDQLAAEGNPEAIPLPLPMLRRDRVDFSFSGLKTAAGRAAEKLLAEHGGVIPRPQLCDWAASVQQAITQVLVEKSVAAAREAEVQDLVITGGVAANRGLRERAQDATRRQRGLRIWFPHPSVCTDNAAMIAGLASALVEYKANELLLGMTTLNLKKGPGRCTLNAEAGLSILPAGYWSQFDM